MNRTMSSRPRVIEVTVHYDMRMKTTTLADVPLEAIHAAFVEAFSDYVVPMNPSLADFAEMMRRRGVDLSLSVGMLEGERLAGFTLNGIDTVNGRRIGYDSGTGVIPSHRRHHFAELMMNTSFDLLSGADVSEYVLEVLSQNSPAVALYERLGFTTVRELSCWSIDQPIETRLVEHVVVHVERKFDLAEATAFIDVEPSWQNTTASIHRSGAEHLTIVAKEGRRTIGYSVVFPGGGDVPQIAVAPEERRKGIGTLLLSATRASAGKPLRILNVDRRAKAFEEFVIHRDARLIATQLEMRRELA